MVHSPVNGLINPYKEIPLKMSNVLMGFHAH